MAQLTFITKASIKNNTQIIDNQIMLNYFYT